MEQQHWNYNLSGSRSVHARRQQEMQADLASARRAALPSMPIAYRRVAQLTFILLLGLILISAAVDVNHVTSANSSTPDSAAPAQAVEPADDAPAYVGAGGCSPGHGVQTTTFTDC